MSRLLFSFVLSCGRSVTTGELLVFASAIQQDKICRNNNEIMVTLGMVNCYKDYVLT